MGKTFFECCRKVSITVVRITFYGWRGSFWGGFSMGKFLFFSFFELRWNIFWFLTFSLRHNCQNHMVSARKNAVNKKLFFSTELFWLGYSRILGEMFLRFGRKNLAGLSKQPSTYPGNYFDPIFSSENKIQYLFFGFWANIF